MLVDKGLSEIDEQEQELLHGRWFVVKPEKSHWLRDSLIVFACLMTGILLFFYYDGRKNRHGSNDE